MLPIKYQTISGDPDGKEDENQLSAYDIAVIAKHLSRIFLRHQIYQTDSSFSKHQIETPEPDARRHAELPFRALMAYGSATLWYHHASTTQNGIHMITGCPGSGGS